MWDASTLAMFACWYYYGAYLVSRKVQKSAPFRIGRAFDSVKSWGRLPTSNCAHLTLQKFVTVLGPKGWDLGETGPVMLGFNETSRMSPRGELTNLW